jgi:probable phosphoglycerate mutase
VRVAPVTTFLLIRHAMCDHVGRTIAGRSPDVHLNDAGLTQAERLAELLDDVPLDAVASSPLPRALETATPLTRRRNLPLQVLESLSEIDYGHWTGRSLDGLAPEARWRRFNALRSVTRVPGGELMLEVQARAVTTLELLRERYPQGRCAVVSHGDVIRSLIAHCAGISLDLFHRLEIAPASLSVVVVDEGWIGVRCVNVTADAWSAFD